MGVKWTQDRDLIVTDWTLYRVESVSPIRYTKGNKETKGK